MKYYSEDWIRDCILNYKRVLVGDYGHWCPDWDFLPIDESCKEFDCCTCDKEKHENEEE